MELILYCAVGFCATVVVGWLFDIIIWLDDNI